jgi:hypothetical protein
MEANITVEDIDLIMDALGEYESSELRKANQGALFGAIIGSMVKDEAVQKKMEEDRQRQQIEAEQKDIEIKEKSIMLKSKLIVIKHAVGAKQAVNW